MRSIFSILLVTLIMLPTLISLLLTVFPWPARASPVGFEPELFTQEAPAAAAHGWGDVEADIARAEEERADAARLQEEEANRTAYANSQKYFHEPASHDVGADDRLGHYDTRFFRRQLGEEDKRASQVHMVRAFLETFREKGLETWLAHGTLLGWYWNTQILPWDWDIDAQVSESTLFYLADHLNATWYSYTSALSTDHSPASSASPATLAQPVTRTYLLDVNPHVRDRANGDGFNIIDARWISVADGLYIDITGLSALDPPGAAGELGCKNFHTYQRRHLWPLREAKFEGVRANVPFAYRKILADEYSVDAMVRLEWEGHRWNDEEMQWIRIPEEEREREKEKERERQREEEEKKSEEEKEADLGSA